MNILVYVEGESDKLALETLLAHEIARLQQAGTSLRFFPAPSGDAKKHVLLRVPERAASILANDESAVVVALPDLYPANKGFRHDTCGEIEAQQRQHVERLLRQRGSDERALARFHTFCLKHDLEALVLAAEESLAARLAVAPAALRGRWRVPVEDQDLEHPPKRVVEELFRERGLRYDGRVDAPLILRDARLDALVERCPQCFKPFVEWLRSLT